MAHTYAYDEPSGIGTVSDGAQSFTVDLSVGDFNRKIHGHLAPGAGRWLEKINAGDGSIDYATKRVRITSIGFDETAKDDTTRDEVVALRAEMAQELADGLGITLARARFLVGFLWRFNRKYDRISGRL
jgi:hypothetical protein